MMEMVLLRHLTSLEGTKNSNLNYWLCQHQQAHNNFDSVKMKNLIFTFTQSFKLYACLLRARAEKLRTIHTPRFFLPSSGVGKKIFYYFSQVHKVG